MERKLATIRKISDLQPIEGADFIEVARIDNWNVIVKKGEFNIGDLCIYCEIDSVLPETEDFEFLRNKKFRIKTMKMKGVISQGIAFPVSIVNPPEQRVGFFEGEDVTELIGVKKYEPEIPATMGGKIKGYFPSFLIKTDEERIQNIPWEQFYNKYKDVDFYVTEKVDGTSFTAFVKDGEFGVCSRNMELCEEEGNLYWDIAKQYGLKEKMLIGANHAIQGEIIGNGVQSNKLKISGRELRLFNLFDINGIKYENFANLEQTAKRYELETVPIVHSSFRLLPDVNEMIALADGQSLINPSAIREGLVFRPKEEMADLKLGRLSFKIVSNKYLLKHGE